MSNPLRCIRQFRPTICSILAPSHILTQTRCCRTSRSRETGTTLPCPTTKPSETSPG